MAISSITELTFTVVSLEQFKQPIFNSLSGRTTSNGTQLNVINKTCIILTKFKISKQQKAENK